MLVSNTYHPVGQGLFVSGHFFPRRSSRRFSWVFDCGAMRDQQPLKDEIQRFQNILRGGRLGMACVSHFDKDHISGIKLLLASIKTDVIVLPYMPLTKRIALLVEDNANDWYADFLIDPAAHLLAVANDDQTRVIYIAGGDDGTEPPPDLDDPDNPDLGPEDNHRGDDREDDPLEPKFPTGEPVSDADAPTLAASGKSTRAEVVTHDKPILLGNRWEFVFYNEARPKKSIHLLQEAVLTILAKHRKSDGTYDGTPLLTDLKNAYGTSFGKGGVNANRISLVMYSGPVRRTHPGWPYMDDVFDRIDAMMLWFDLWESVPQGWAARCFGSMLGGTLLTGDIFFDKVHKVQAAKDHISSKRWARVDVLQVPHHGSDKNWFPGAAKEFNHRISVFSAQSGSTHHPGTMVKKDLASIGPVFVSEAAGFTVTGTLGKR